MAVNVFAGSRTVITATVTTPISSTPVSQANVEVIFRYAPGFPVSTYKPGRPTNGFQNFIKGESYLFQAKQDIDMTPYGGPPFAEGGGAAVNYGAAFGNAT